MFTRLTVRISIMLILVTVITSCSILYVSNFVLQKTIKDNLIETIDSNISEVEFFSDIVEDNDVNQFIEYSNGYLEIADDYLNKTNGITSALYFENGTLLYGENPIGRKADDIAFVEEDVRTVSYGGMDYYVYDKKLSGNGLDGLWLRGVVSSEQGLYQLSSIERFSLIILPVLVLLSIFFGWYFAKKALDPIEKISETAEHISKDSDLNKRIVLSKGDDEVHRLAESFNNMLARLDEAFKMQKQFTSDASHELKTPISVILAQCEFSLSDDQEAEDYREAIETIQRQGKKMDSMVSDMLAGTKLDSNAENIKKEELNLSRLVNAVCKDMQFVKDKNISLTYNIQEDVCLNANSDFLTRMLINLISNAYKYGVENGHIVVTLEKSAEKIVLCVEDDGIGIAPSEQERIFNRFYQVDPSHSNDGAGLGLTLVLQIARFHNARVEVESELGKGSKFIVIF